MDAIGRRHVLVTCAACSVLHGLTGLTVANQRWAAKHQHPKQVKYFDLIIERLMLPQMYIFTQRIFFACIADIFIAAYGNCANDPYCAASSVQGYMTRFAQVNHNLID